MKKNIGLMASSTYLRIGSQFVVFLILARMLGPEKFGSISYWMSVSMLVAIPINFGFGTQLLREIGRSPERTPAIIANMFVAKLLIALVVTLLAVIISVFIADRLDLFLLFMLMALAESFIDFLNNALRSIGCFAAEARLALVCSIFQFLLLCSIAFTMPNTICVAIGYTVSRLFTLILTIRAIQLYIPLNKIRPHLTISTIPHTLHSGFPYAADKGVSTLNAVLDNVVLKHFTDVRSVGVYQAGSRLMLGGTTFATVLSNVYLPSISALDCQSIAYAKAVDRLNLISIVAGGMIGLIFAFGNNFIVEHLFGTNYGKLAELLPWFGLVLLLRYIAASYGVILTSLGQQKVRVIANSAYMVCFAISAVVLISRYGTVGILIASTLATILLIIIYFASLMKNKCSYRLNLSTLPLLLMFVAAILIKVSGVIK